jgi:hypothetical protein
MPFRLSKKVTLNEGDRVRISGGPYYVTKDGKKISMGEKGEGVFTSATADGKGIYVRFPKYGSPRYVYIGPQGVSEETGTILRPHKVVKLRV